MVRAPNRTVTRALTIFLATGAYSGYSPFAPGTAGSAVGLLLVWGGFGPLWSRSPLAALVVFAGAFAISCAIAGRAEEIFNQPDCSKIVIDEILGMAATMFGNPTTTPWMAAGFLAFRVFDVIKPFPAGLIDRRIGGGTGVMLDDLAAAIYANVVLQVARRLL
jgi:phosphatidylglycerophosphatase A